MIWMKEALHPKIHLKIRKSWNYWKNKNRNRLNL